MIINDTIFDVELFDVLQKLKQQLAKNNIPLLNKMFDSGEDVMTQCPYHKNGQERKPSAGIRKSDGLFHCLACGETHTLPEVISYCFGYNDPLGREGYKWLCKNFSSVQVAERDDIDLDLDRTAVKTNKQFIGEEELDTYRYVHNYMYERGLTDDVIEKFDVGYDKHTDSITFPVRDINGNCMFVARRSVKTKHFNIPKGVSKPLYGMYELCQHILIPRGSTRYSIIVPDKVYVCEGPFDCLRLWCVGKYAVAGFGCLFNSYQVKQLQDLPCRVIVLALDNDDAGRKATKILQTTLTNKLVYKAVIPSNRKDVGECTDEELEQLAEELL